MASNTKAAPSSSWLPPLSCVVCGLVRRLEAISSKVPGQPSSPHDSAAQVNESRGHLGLARGGERPRPGELRSKATSNEQGASKRASERAASRQQARQTSPSSRTEGEPLVARLLFQFNSGAARFFVLAAVSWVAVQSK